MCEHCGCGQNTALRHAHEKSVKVDVEEMVLSKNQEIAEKNRALFHAMNVLVINLVSSPGAGKTTILERTLAELKNEIRLGVIEGDQYSDKDAERIEKLGVLVKQINTLDGCHLDADMIKQAARHFPLSDIELLFIENVGNLICPASFDLGEDLRVVILSTAEGEDKPIKYPTIFSGSQLALLNKVDLLSLLELDQKVFVDSIKRVNPAIECLSISAKTGEGMDSWYRLIREKVKGKKEVTCKQ